MKSLYYISVGLLLIIYFAGPSASNKYFYLLSKTDNLSMGGGIKPGHGPNYTEPEENEQPLSKETKDTQPPVEEEVRKRREDASTKPLGCIRIGPEKTEIKDPNGSARREDIRAVICNQPLPLSSLK